MLKFYFNKQALEALAKECRRASWGAGAASAAIGYQAVSGAALLLGATAWTVLQLVAVLLESIKEDRGGKE